MELFARTCNYDVMDTERIGARLFVGVGGLIWAVLSIGAAFVYPSNAGLMAYLPALLVTVLAIVAFLLGWFFENAAAVLLFAGAIATIVWGILARWEAGVWGVMALFLLAPEIVGGVLFLAAARMQKVCELQERARA